MTINRQWQAVSVITYTNTLDSYGQARRTEASRRSVDMVCKILNQYDNNQPTYIDCNMLFLTKDFTITTENALYYNSKTYNIKYLIPSGKYLQVLAKEVV